MAFGRVLFGLGGESLEVAQARITTDWFQGRALAFALGLNLSASRIATAANDNLSPWIAGRLGTPWAGWMGCVMCLGSLGSGVAMVYLDSEKSRAKAGVINYDERKPLLPGSGDGISTEHHHVKQSPTSDPAGAVLGKRTSIGSVTTLTVELEDDTESVEYVEEDETVHFEQIKGLSMSFWFLCLATITLYGSAVPFFHICTDFFQQKWYPGDSQKAGMVMSIPDLVSAVGSPLCGLYVDRYGHRGTLLPIAGLLTFITHAVMCFTSITPIIPMTILGVSYSVFASALWPCVPYLVGRHQIATAYGFVTVALNLSLAVFPLVVAQVRNAHPENFTYVEYFFMGLSLVSVAVSIGLNVLDSRNGSVLSKSHRHVASVRVQDEGVDETSPLLGRNHRGGSESGDLTVKVVGEGMLIPSPHTYIHHRHHHHHHDGTSAAGSQLSRSCNCAEDNGGWDSVPGSVTTHAALRSGPRSPPEGREEFIQPAVGSSRASGQEVRSRSPTKGGFRAGRVGTGGERDGS
ncbi:hypothetical protein HK104_005359 [Borealophlyctis nickersoniae]|nr:hypothetical protein HK104_005359 [Borealophlyctis nickersoniae]